MNFLDALLAELQRRGWPAPNALNLPQSACWQSHNRPQWGMISFISVSIAKQAFVVARTTGVYTTWLTVREAADQCDRLLAQLHPGEIPCLDPPTPPRLSVIDGATVVVTGPPS
jgi:hypothetical protein